MNLNVKRQNNKLERLVCFIHKIVLDMKSSGIISN